MTTQEGNKLIAHFMGAVKSEVDGNSRYLRFAQPHAGTVTYAFFPEDLKYHTSWDWLMPVVEKIEKTNRVGDKEWYPYTFTIWQNSCLISDGNNGYEVLRKYAETKIDAVWKGCVAFIQWYNSTKPVNQ